MKVAIVIGGAVMAGAALVYAATGLPQAAGQPEGDQPAPQGEAAQGEIDQADALAYGVGFFLGNEVRTGLEADGVEVDLDRVVEGFVDGLQQRGAAYDPETLDAILEAVHEEMQARRVQRLMETDPAFRKLAETNAAKSAAFMKASAQREGAQELIDGVLYEVLESGSGQSAADADRVVATFEVSTMSGTPVLTGQDAEIELAEVKEGARAILRRMKVGDHWRVVVAPEKAFGLAGLPPHVGPNEAVVIDVELLEVP